MFQLAFRNLTRRLGQSVVSALIVCIATFSLVAAACVVQSVERSASLTQQRLGADCMVLPAGAAGNAQNVLFTANPVNIYLDSSVVESVAAVPGVAAVTPQFFTQTVDQSCCSVVGVTRVVGIDAASDFTVSPWVAGDAAPALGPHDIWVGSAAPQILGGQASILGETFTVAGNLEPTGSSVDETIFMDIDAARSIAAASPYLEGVWAGVDPATKVSCVMVKAAEGTNVDELVTALTQACPGAVAVSTSSMIAGVSNQIGAVSAVAGVLLALLAVLAALALAGRISALVSARAKELGLLRSLGVGRSRVGAYLACETGLVTLVGAVVGIVLGCAVGAWATGFAHETFSLPGAAPGAATYAVAALAGLVFAVVLNALALIAPLARLARTDPQEALAKGDLA